MNTSADNIFNQFGDDMDSFTLNRNTIRKIISFWCIGIDYTIEIEVNEIQIHIAITMLPCELIAAIEELSSTDYQQDIDRSYSVTDYQQHIDR